MDIREQVAIRLYAVFCRAKHWEITWDDEPQVVKDEYLEQADQILSIPGIRVEAENQELPRIPKQFQSTSYITDVYADGWRNGVAWLKKKLKGDKTGVWRKVLPKEGEKMKWQVIGGA